MKFWKDLTFLTLGNSDYDYAFTESWVISLYVKNWVIYRGFSECVLFQKIIENHRNLAELRSRLQKDSYEHPATGSVTVEKKKRLFVNITNLSLYDLS